MICSKHNLRNCVPSLFHWRYVMCQSVTMKIHDIESHLPALKYEFGQLGQLVEENSERGHHLRNRLAQAYSHISDPEKRANA